GGDPGDLKHSNHVLYLKNINKDEMTTIDSLSGELNKSAKNNIKSDTVVHVSDFPNSEKSIENEIDENKINKIETDILGQKEDILKAEVTNNNEEKEVTNNNKEPEDDKEQDINIANQKSIEQIDSNDNNVKSSDNKEKVEDNSSKFENSNENGKSNNSHVNLEFNNNKQVIVNEENIDIANQEHIAQIKQINFNDDYGKSETEETHNSSQSSSTQKPSNKFKNIGIAAIILGVLGFVITLIIKLLLIEALSLLVVILPPLVPIVVGIILIYIHTKLYTPMPNEIRAYRERNSLEESIQHTQGRNHERNQERDQEQESVTGDRKANQHGNELGD
ncbi:MAG: hypothetical protein IJU86_03770, partial [Firmicutes bacterium]|nr:hypothetical protein [Bacillota bacterium]